MAEDTSNTLQRHNEEVYKAPYVEWYERDFWSLNVRRLPALARLMYRSLLQQGWHSDRPPYLPNDDATLQVMADAPSLDVWQEHRSKILAQLTLTDDGQWYFHPKSLLIYAKVVRAFEGRKQGGIESGKTRSKNKDTSKTPRTEQEVTTRRVCIQNQIQNQNQIKENNQPATSKDETPEGTPEGLSVIQYAQPILEDVGLPVNRSLQMEVGAAITAVGKKHGLSDAAAFERLRKRVLDAKDRGEKIGRFWFQEAENIGTLDEPKPAPKPYSRIAHLLERKRRMEAGEELD